MIPYGRQQIEEDDIAAVADVLRSDWLTGGPVAADFEQLLVAVVGAKHGVVCANGTAALHLAALALKLGPGDAVVVPSITFLATANAARYVGAEVIFADVDPETGLMTEDSLHRALEVTGRGDIKAVFPVHLGGQSVDMPPIETASRARGAAVVEDACHALGTRYLNGQGADGPVGDCRFSDMAVFSFHPVKTIAMGEGGAITTNDPRLAEALARLRNHGMVREPGSWANADLGFDADGVANPWYYEMPEMGFNYRANELQCALGLSQLRKLGRFAERRQELARRYDELLPRLAPLVSPVRRLSTSDAVWHLYAVRIDFAAAGISRRELMEGLRSRGIGTQVHYIPVHRQPYYEERYGRADLPGADAYYGGTLSLPLFPGMADSDPERVVDALEAELNRAG